MMAAIVPASDMRCQSCDVDWMVAELGPNCWECGEPGIPGYVMPAVFGHGDPYVAKDGGEV